MDTQLYRLTYTSRIDMPPVERLRRAEVDRILASSRRHNLKNDITGALLVTDRGFVQILEGPKSAVDETFARIKRDARHADLLVLSTETIADRGFSGWPMAFIDAGEMDDDAPLMMAEFGLFTALRRQVDAQEQGRRNIRSIAA
jgi:hypothetical protein